MVEATSKGIRVGILHNDRVSATTDEVVNTFPTPWSDHQQAHAHVNHLPRSKCNTWTQGERDDVCTANGTIHLKAYAFQLKAFGQNEACEWVWRPTENGWQKRLSVAISPNKNPIDEDANANFSMGLMQTFHDWMFQGPFASPQYLCYDEWSLNMYRVVNRAVDDWIDKHAATDKPVERYLQVKLRFAFSDLRRFSHFAMRGAQYLEAITPAKLNLFDANRKEVNPWECAAGVHWWLRQVSLHAGFYRFWASHQSVNHRVARRMLAAVVKPPRGVLRRLAKLFDVELHSDNRLQGWRSRKEFREEVRRLQQWYSQGRQRTMWRRTMKRSRTAPDRVKGRKCVMNCKLKTHLQYLRSLKMVERLWAWRLHSRFRDGARVHADLLLPGLWAWQLH